MRFIAVVLLIFTTSCYVGEELAPDQDIWEYALPQEVGLSNDILLELNERIKLNEFQEINGLIIIKNDKLVFENHYMRYVNTFDQVFRKVELEKRNLGYNIGSSGLLFTLAAIGVAEDKRLLSIQDPIMNYLPEYEDVFNDDPDKGGITIAHLLGHKSGFSWDESIQPSSQVNSLALMKGSDDWCRYILERPLEAPPGFRFNLNTGGGVLLAKIIENASGQDFETFLTESILEPLTITSFTIDSDSQGSYNAGDGMSVSLLDWTKLSYLFLKEGIWKNRKIIDPNFIENATTLQTVVSGEYNMGYIWWLYGDNFSRAFGIPHDEIIYLPGELGQHMYIIPSENMIVSIFAENYFFRFQNPSLNLFAEITYSFQ